MATSGSTKQRVCQQMKPVNTAPLFFARPADFRKWLKVHHESDRELWVGFYRKATGRPSITWPESVDEALCVGWIDGLRKTIDAESYMIRFTPRKATSNWSAVNIGRVKELTKQGRMKPAGLTAFELRKEEKSGIYAYENRKSAVLGAADEKQFRARRIAWDFFQRQPAGYRKLMTWRVISAKREETKNKRLEKLISESAAGRRLL
jgi:uncharacterized protein YdeI (YjbR/CyaY-like superfamily)